MKVELIQFYGINMATGKEQALPQYKVVVDGTVVGYKGWKFGTPVCFIGRLSPLDKSIVEDEVQALIGDSADGIMPMEYTPEDENLEEDYYDDFAN